MNPKTSRHEGAAGMDIDREAANELARDRDGIETRLQTAREAASKLWSAGKLLRVEGVIFGPGRVSATSPRGNGNDEHVGIATLILIASELVGTSAALLCGRNHYSGAALLRQVVEVEYLTWAFANNKRDAACWLNSSSRERLDLFSPARLRMDSEGQFQQADYRGHCELGGHPVPGALERLAGSDVVLAQTLVVDLLQHGRSITNNVIEWQEGSGTSRNFREEISAAQQCLAAWAQRDPFYSYSLQISRLLTTSPPI